MAEFVASHPVNAHGPRPDVVPDVARDGDVAAVGPMLPSVLAAAIYPHLVRRVIGLRHGKRAFKDAVPVAAKTEGVRAEAAKSLNASFSNNTTKKVIEQMKLEMRKRMDGFDQQIAQRLALEL